MTLQDCLEQVFKQFSTSDIFHGHGIDNPWDEAVALVCHVLDLAVDSDTSVLQNTVSDLQWQKIEALVQQRIEKHIPIFYLTHEAWFMGLPFYVDERVLIPRSPFAEWIEKRFEPWLDPLSVKTILEIGTGSGCMAIAASYSFADALIDAVDISEDALAVAAKNVQSHHKTDRVRLYHSDCFSAVEPLQQYDLILSNPPYVSQEEIDELPQEYSHEPLSIALYAPEQGMAIVDRILAQAQNYLSAHGILVVEVGYSDEQLMARYPQVPFTWLECEAGGQGLFLLTRQQLENINVRK